MSAVVNEIKDILGLAVQSIRSPRQQLLLSVVVLMLAIGVIFYSWQEGWSFIDSLYFTVITLTTIGYGDFVPTTTLSRFFTIGYVLVGIGIFGLAINALMSRQQRRVRERMEARREEAQREAGDTDAPADASEYREALSEPLVETLSHTLGKYHDELGELSESHRSLRSDLTQALENQSAVLSRLTEQLQSLESKVDQIVNVTPGQDDEANG